MHRQSNVQAKAHPIKESFTLDTTNDLNPRRSHLAAPGYATHTSTKEHRRNVGWNRGCKTCNFAEKLRKHHGIHDVDNEYNEVEVDSILATNARKVPMALVLAGVPPEETHVHKLKHFMEYETQDGHNRRHQPHLDSRKEGMTTSNRNKDMYRRMVHDDIKAHKHNQYGKYDPHSYKYRITY